MRQRVFVISDLHLSQPPVPLMMRHASLLADFIKGVSEDREEGLEVHLMIAGDFVDFLSLEPFEAVTRDPKVACRKLRHALAGSNACVVQALADAVRSGVQLTVMAGNHDIEWAHPEVQRAFAELLEVDARRLAFVVHGEAWRLGGLLVEHGNRYDGANENDWDGMRTLVSSQSRGETLHARDKYRFGELVKPAAGSELVVNVLNYVRDRYPFVPLLQPEGMLTAMLLLVLEPSLDADWRKVATLLAAQQATSREAPSAPRNVSAEAPHVDADLDRAFPGYYRSLLLQSGYRDVSLGDWVRLFAAARPESVSEALRQGQPVPRESLKRLQLVLRKLQPDPSVFTLAGEPGALGSAAKDIVGRDGIQLVVMGHTHQARVVGADPVPPYINTGTWTDMVVVPADALEEGKEALDALEAFLMRLQRGDPLSHDFRPTYAKVDLLDGIVTSARLELASQT